MPTRIHLLVPVLSLFLLSGNWRAGDPPPAHQDGEVSFFAPELAIWLDRTQVVPFELDGAADADATLEASVDDAGVLSIVREPAVLAGRSTGYVRVRGLGEGRTTLRVAGASAVVVVVPVPAAARINRVTARVVGTAPGAVVWGRFAVGAEVMPGTTDAAGISVRLRLSDGSALEPTASLPADRGAARRFAFEVDADRIEPGPLVLTALVERAGETVVESDPLRVTVQRAAEGALHRVECEDSLDTPRPERFGEAAPLVGSHPDASGGEFVINAAANPAWLTPFEVPRDGLYQAMVVARGDFGAGAFPSIGLSVDEPDPVRTTARLVDRRWQRIPVGRPVPLEAGARTLSVRFLNDQRVSATSDRNLYLDRFELLRLDDDYGTGLAIEASMTMSGGAMTMEAMDDEESAASPWSAGLWIGLERPLDGLPVNGRLRIDGFCRWADMATTPAPRVELVLNGRAVSSQQAAKPVFALDRAALAEGANEIQLVATSADGERASTPVQTVWVRGRAGDHAPRAFHRFSVHDERWDPSIRATLTDRGQETGHRVAVPKATARFELRLPETLEGDFDIILDARGPDPRPAEIRVALVTESGESEVERVDVQNWWNYRPAGRVSLEPGEKTLAVELDPKGTADGERSLSLRAVALRTHRDAPDRTAPRAEIVYPAAGHLAHGVDAVVVEAFDDERVQSADILVDGRPQGTFAHIPESAGYLTLPLLLRDVSPGEHAISVRAVDAAGNMGESREVTIVVAAEAPERLGTYSRAIHLLNRFAFGPDPGELAAILTAGEAAWLEDRLGRGGQGDAAAQGFAVALRGDDFYYDVDRSVLAHALRTTNPVHARLVMWIENHFSTWVGKTGAPSEWYEHQLFLELGATAFSELLHASATSPTMLQYLDQSRSYSGRLNENYAREIMELHTLGVHGGYTQEEVTSLASILTGLTLAQEAPPDGEGGYMIHQFRFDPDLGEGVSRDLMGMRFERAGHGERLDRLRLVLELLAAHPSTARYVAGELAAHYVSSPPPEGLVDDLARVYTASGGDLRAMLVAIAEHPDFWGPDAGPRLTTPFDYGVRLARAAGVPTVDWAVREYLRQSGMGIYDRATPDGYPDDDAEWVDTNSMMQRWRLAQRIPWAVRNLVPNQVRNPAAGDIDRWFQRVVDIAAVRLTGQPLGEESNRAAVEFLATAEGNSWQRVDQTTVLVCRMPEANLK